MSRIVTKYFLTNNGKSTLLFKGHSLIPYPTNLCTLHKGFLFVPTGGSIHSEHIPSCRNGNKILFSISWIYFCSWLKSDVHFPWLALIFPFSWISSQISIKECLISLTVVRVSTDNRIIHHPKLCKGQPQSSFLTNSRYVTVSCKYWECTKKF